MKGIRGVIKEFKDFAVKGDAFSLAIGVVIGASFKSVIDSLIKDVLLPPINFFTDKIDFADLFFTVGTRQNFDSLKAAEDAGVIVIRYGNFLNESIIFILTAFALFIFIYKFQQFLTRRERQEKKVKPTRKCPHCFQEISTKATKCPYCTSAVKPTFKGEGA